MRTGEAEIEPRKVCSLPLGEGTQVEVRIGRYGPFLSDGTLRCSVPETLAPDELDLAKAREMLQRAEAGPDPLGPDPETGLPVYLKQGRYGPYVQRGDSDKDQGFKRASLLKGMEAETVGLATALRLLSLPRALGKHPDGQQDVVAANGRYGPYVKAGDEIRSIPAELSPLDIALDQAVELLRQEKRSRRPATRSEPLKILGKHPVTEKELRVLSGRYGPYVTDGEIHASLPQGLSPADVTQEQAVDLLQARAARIADRAGPKPKRRARRRG